MENVLEKPGPDRPDRKLPFLSAAKGFDLLEGVRVLDLTTSVAGPSATMLLADLGAEVIKVERRHAGDDARAWGPPFIEGESLWFVSINRNKKSIALDFTGDAGKLVLYDILAHCDVCIVSQPPQTAAKLGVDGDTLRARKPDLIYVSITGFGMDGPRAQWTCYDLIAEGYSGVMDLTGELDSGPQKVGAPAADMLAGQDAALATVSALFARARSGRGCVIDITLVESMTRFMACRIVPYLGSGEAPRRSGGRDSVIAIYQAFQTADNPITVGLGNDGIWKRFWAAVGKPDVALQPAYRSNADRRERRPEIVEMIEKILVTATRDEWLQRFQVARVPAGPINRIDEVVQDQVLLERGMFYRTATEDGSDVPQVGTGFRIDGQHNRPRSGPPKLGQDSRSLLNSLLGYDQAKIRALAEAGVI